MEEMTISEVAQKAGLRPSAIRYYESINILPLAHRVSGQRRYDPAILDRLAFIRITQRLGFTLAEIQVLLTEREKDMPLSANWQQLTQQKIAEVENLIQNALEMKRFLIQGLNCGCANLFDCINCVLIQCTPPQNEKI